MRIGVFDSGVGGKSVARAIEKAFPEHQIEYVNDKQHVPYGTKSPDEIAVFVIPILQDLATRCGIIVIACNTVTTTLIAKLREVIPVQLIGIEPMIKPASAQTKSKVIAVCATPTTLQSPRYAWLKETYAKNIKVIEPDCSDWAYMIESDNLNRKTIENRINAVCQAGADVIVLGCTHFHWIEQLINQIADGRAVVIQPEQAIIARLRDLLAEQKQPA
jgi:glutamate racemase